MSLSLVTAGSILIRPNLRLRQSHLTISSSPSLSLSSSSHRKISRLIKVNAMETKAETISGGVPNNTMKLLFVEMGVGYDQHGQDVTSAAMKACKNAISSNSIPAFRRGSIPGVSFGEMKLQIKLGAKQPRDRDGDRKLGRERGRKTSNLKFVDTETFPERLLLCPSPYPTILDVPGSPHTYWGRFLCVPETSPSPRRTRYVRRHQVGVPVQPRLGVPRSLHHQLDLDKVKSIFPYGEIVNVEVVDGGLICSSGVLVEEMGDKNEDCYIVNAAVYVGY